MLTKAGYELNDIGRTLSWDALDSFLKNITVESALYREQEPESAAWVSSLKTNAILADIFDMLANINANLVAIGSHKPAKQPKAYPRPWKQDKNEKQIGSGGLPPDQLRAWMEEKRQQHARSSTGHNYSDPSNGRGTGENYK